MERDYLDFDLALVRAGGELVARVLGSPAGPADAPFVLPFTAVELAQFMNAVGPARVASRRLVPAATRVLDVKEYGRRLTAALLSGDVDRAFRESLHLAKQQRLGLRVRLRLDSVPDLDSVPWEYLYDARLGRFLTLSTQTPVVRVLDSLDDPPPVQLHAPLRVLVLISSPTDLPRLQVEREEQLLRATTGDLVQSGRLEIVVLADATLSTLQRALLQHFHVFHFIGHGGFDLGPDQGVLALDREDGTAHRVSGDQLGTLLHDAEDMQLVVLNACEGARSSGRDAFSGVAQSLVRQGLPAVVAMQTEISDRAALVFSHEFYYFLTRGLPVDAAMCEVRKAMALADEAAEWGTPVLLRSGSGQPFDLRAFGRVAELAPESRWESLYTAAQQAVAAGSLHVALPLLEQLAAERPDYADAAALLDGLRQTGSGPQGTTPQTQPPTPAPAAPPEAPTEDGQTPEGGSPEREPQPTRPQPASRQPSTRPRPTPFARRAGRSGRRRLRVGTVLKMVFWAALLIGGFSAWLNLPSLAQRVGPLVEAACGSASQPSPAPSPQASRSSLVVGCAPFAPVVDREFDDWRSLPSHLVSSVVEPPGGDRAGVASSWQLLWDQDALYVHVVVTDPKITPVRSSDPRSFSAGDSVSFELGPDPRRLRPTEGLRPGRDVHVVLGVADDGDRDAVAAIQVAAKDAFGAPRLARDIDVARRATAAGYELEGRVPWALLGREIAPARGSVIGLNLNVSDASATGKLRLALSSNPEWSGKAQLRPALWHTALLRDES